MQTSMIALRQNFFEKMAEPKAERARKLYPHTEFDCALPIAWIHHVCDVLGLKPYHVVPNFVWGYSRQSKPFGEPLPITEQGLEILEDWRNA